MLMLFLLNDNLPQWLVPTIGEGWWHYKSQVSKQFKIKNQKKKSKTFDLFKLQVIEQKTSFTFKKLWIFVIYLHRKFTKDDFVCN
jgi:hypothetical protein